MKVVIETQLIRRTRSTTKKCVRFAPWLQEATLGMLKRRKVETCGRIISLL